MSSLSGTPLLTATAAILACLAAGSLAMDSQAREPRSFPVPETWVCYYGSEDRTEELLRFDLTVTDPGAPVPPREDGGPIRLGYISLGEVDEWHPVFARARDEGLLIQASDMWDSWLVDARNPRWRELVLFTLVPDILAKGFDGLFLDTLDSSLYLEEQDSESYGGMLAAQADLIRTIRAMYPAIAICQNRGFALLEHTAAHIDYLLIEELFSIYHPDEDAYVPTTDEDRLYLDNAVAPGLAANPDLVVLSIDYVRPGDAESARRAITHALDKGYVPYVGPFLLDDIYDYTLGD